MGKKSTSRTEDSTIRAFEKIINAKRDSLDKKGKKVEGHDYVFFYAAIGDKVTAKYPEVLTDNRTIWQSAMIGYMEKRDGSIEKFLNKIIEHVQKLPLHMSFKLNDKRRKQSLSTHRAKFFPYKEKTGIDAEHAIQYHLLYNTHPEFGKFIAYEFPTDADNHFGGIDLISYHPDKNELRLIELKKSKFGKSEDSSEMFLRAYTEIITYRACFDMVMKERKKELQAEFEELGKGLDFEIDWDKVKIVNCIIGPKSLYDDVDERLRAFVNSTDNPAYQVKLYSLRVHEEEIEHNPIGHPEMMVDISEEHFN